MTQHQMSRETIEDWLVVVTSAIGLAISLTHVYSMGAFIIPLQDEFGWSRSQISGGLSFVSVVSVLLAPFVGYSIDRVGSRRIALLGMAIYCGGLFALSFISKFIWHWWLTWVALAFGSILIKPTVWMVAVSSRFNRRRGLAIGLAMSGTGLSAATMPTIATELIQTLGWRAAYMSLGVGGVLIAFPMMLLFFKDRSASSGTEKSSQPVLKPGMTIRAAIRSSRFVRLLIASFLVSFVIMGLTVHFVPILASHSISASASAAIAGSIGLCSMIARVGTGYLLDRYNGPVIAAIAFVLPLFACALLLNFDGSTISALLVGAILGFSLGAEVDVIAYLSSRYFGMRNYGTLFGTMVGVFSVGLGFGPTIAGAIFDEFGSYDWVFWTFGPVCAVSAALVGFLGPYPDFTANYDHRQKGKPNPPTN